MALRVVCSDNLNTAHTARLYSPQLWNLVFLARNLGSTNQKETQQQPANTTHNMEEDIQKKGMREVYFMFPKIYRIHIFKQINNNYCYCYYYK